MKALDEVVDTVQASLHDYQPQRLGIYFKDDRFFSETLTFLDFLINGEWQVRTYPSSDISNVLSRKRPFFPHNTIALQGVSDRQYAACIGIAEYPEHTEAGLLNALLSAPCPLILSQSFQFLSKPLATQLLIKQQNRLSTTGDLAQSQVAAISLALDELTSNRIVYGEHHLTLTLLADTPVQLENHLANIKSQLADLSIISVREDTALAAADWSQLPANHKYRPRPAPISSRNFTGFCSFHNNPLGQIDGNQWGAAVTVFKLLLVRLITLTFMNRVLPSIGNKVLRPNT